jgi:hypothetical protein
MNQAMREAFTSVQQTRHMNIPLNAQHYKDNVCADGGALEQEAEEAEVEEEL